jgi:opacity protein-like surface antigen
MKKFLLAGAVALAALASPATAADFNLGTLTDVSNNYGNQDVLVGTPNAPVQFTDNFNFTVGGGFNLQSVSITTNYTGDNGGAVASNIDFIEVLLNGTPLVFTQGPNAQTETASLLNQPVLGNNTITVRGTARGDGAYSGVLTLGVSAVPEPATWAMMLVGFGAVGYSMRSRKAGYRLAQAI